MLTGKNMPTAMRALHGCQLIDQVARCIRYGAECALIRADYAHYSHAAVCCMVSTSSTRSVCEPLSAHSVQKEQAKRLHPCVYKHNVSACARACRSLQLPASLGAALGLRPYASRGDLEATIRAALADPAAAAATLRSLAEQQHRQEMERADRRKEKRRARREEVRLSVLTNMCTSFVLPWRR